MSIIIKADDVDNHLFFSGRNVGASRKLCGDIATISCLIKRNSSDFYEKTKANYFNALNEAHAWLEQQARRYNVSLKMKGYFFEIDAPTGLDEDDGWDILKSFFNQENMDALQNKYEVKLNFDETPFLAVFDMHNRSFATMQKNIYPFYINELSTIFRYNNNYNHLTIAHELLHQFGAVDFYFPDKISQSADYHLGPSIMGRAMGNVDDLTAYLIGWKDDISINTYNFLKNTMWYTKEEYENALKETWKAKF